MFIFILALATCHWSPAYVQLATCHHLVKPLGHGTSRPTVREQDAEPKEWGTWRGNKSLRTHIHHQLTERSDPRPNLIQNSERWNFSLLLNVSHYSHSLIQCFFLLSLSLQHRNSFQMWSHVLKFSWSLVLSTWLCLCRWAAVVFLFPVRCQVLPSGPAYCATRVAEIFFGT